MYFESAANLLFLLLTAFFSLGRIRPRAKVQSMPAKSYERAAANSR
jgi:hypothetical protein